MKIIGIYKIINKINDKYYVGSSNDILGRWRSHNSHLNRNIHRNIYLQREWKKYGKNNFNFQIIENVLDKLLLETVEQKYLDKSKIDGKYKCYNLSFIANRIEMTDEVCKKISNHHKGKRLSAETRLKMSISRQKRKDKPMLGKRHKIETRIKMSKSDIFSFVNIKTNETFIGTCFNFRNRYNLNPSSVCALVKGRMKTLYGWKLI